MISGKQTGLKTGTLDKYPDFNSFKNAFKEQIDFFIEKMIYACEVVEKCHQDHLPSPFLSGVVNDCLTNGIDVTRGGAKYNLSGIQAIQVANIADSLAVIKKLVYDDRDLDPLTLLNALRTNFTGNETLRQICINRVPKFGNDIEWMG